MTIRTTTTFCLAGLTAALLAGPALAQINGVGGGAGAHAGGGPSAATIGGGSPSAGMAGSATGATGLSGTGTNGVGSSGFSNPGIPPGTGATTPGLMTAPGTGAAQPVTGVPTPSLPAQVPGRVAPRNGGPR